MSPRFKASELLNFVFQMTFEHINTKLEIDLDVLNIIGYSSIDSISFLYV